VDRKTRGYGKRFWSTQESVARLQRYANNGMSINVGSNAKTPVGRDFHLATNGDINPTPQFEIVRPTGTAVFLSVYTSILRSRQWCLVVTRKASLRPSLEGLKERDAGRIQHLVGISGRFVFFFSTDPDFEVAVQGISIFAPPNICI
jgi:hypothetical protein